MTQLETAVSNVGGCFLALGDLADQEMRTVNSVVIFSPIVH